MAIQTETKQPWESWFIWGSILNVQEAAEVITLAGSTVLAMDKDGKDAQGVIIDMSTVVLGDDPTGSYTDNMLGVRLQGGDPAKSPYMITFKMNTDLDNKYESEMKITVKELPTTPIPMSTTTTTI
jgi:hypothetical protein